MPHKTTPSAAPGTHSACTPQKQSPTTKTSPTPITDFSQPSREIRVSTPGYDIPTTLQYPVLRIITEHAGCLSSRRS